jgi:hypothetical protein
MNIFFECWDTVYAFLERLAWMRCPACGVVGALGLHGFIRGYVDDSCDNEAIRARRIRCRPKRGGCGKTFSLRPGDRLFHYCFGTKQAWGFLRKILAGHSVKAA